MADYGNGIEVVQRQGRNLNFFKAKGRSLLEIRQWRAELRTYRSKRWGSKVGRKIDPKLTAGDLCRS
jgi:hypothetical protein